MGGKAVILKRRRTSFGITEEKLPSFVKILEGSCLRLVRHESEFVEYWRDGGSWGVNYQIKDGKLLSVHRSMPHLNNIELKPVSESECRKCNGRYAPKKSINEGD